MIRNTYEEVLNEFKKNNFELLEKEYGGMDKELRYICNNHIEFGEQKTTYRKLVKYGIESCEFCKSEIANDLFKKKINNIFDNIEVVGKFTAARSRVKVRCTKHDYVWEPLAYNLLSGYGCPKCGFESTASHRRNSIPKIKARLKETNPNAVLIEDIPEIHNTNTDLTLKCNVCNNVWKASIGNLTKKNNPTGCPSCSVIRVADSCRKTRDQFDYEVSLVDTNVIPIGEYKNHNTPMLCKCKIHGCTFYQSPLTILNGSSACRHCQVHKTENNMLKILEKYKIKYTPQKRFDDCRYIGKLSFDAYLDDYNVAIEYDGEGHYKPIPWSRSMDAEEQLEQTKIRDEVKNKYCKENNIGLIRIPYWERSNMESFLLEKFDDFGIKIM